MVVLPIFIEEIGLVYLYTVTFVLKVLLPTFVVMTVFPARLGAKWINFIKPRSSVTILPIFGLANLTEIFLACVVA